MWSMTNRSSRDRKSTRLNSSHSSISYAVFCLKNKKGDGGEGDGTGPPELEQGDHSMRQIGDDTGDDDQRDAVADAARGDLLFFFNEAAATEIYTLSLHDALPI